MYTTSKFNSHWVFGEFIDAAAVGDGAVDGEDDDDDADGVDNDDILNMKEVIFVSS